MVLWFGIRPSGDGRMGKDNAGDYLGENVPSVNRPSPLLPFRQLLT
jgi:hypothetical protein